MGSRYDDLLADIRRKLSARVLPINSVRDAGTPAAVVLPWSADQPEARARAAEILADSDDDLLTRLLRGWVPSRGELETLLAGQTTAGLVNPVFFGSALSGQGGRELTDGIRMLRQPSGPRPPGPRPGVTAPARGTVFAIERGSTGEKVAYLRLFSGELRERQRVTVRRHAPDGQLSEFTGQLSGLAVIGGPGPSRRLCAGSIARLRGLPQVRVGDQVSDRDSHPDLESARLAAPAQFPRPSLETVVRARRPAEAARLHAALVSLADEDPLIRARSDGGGATSVLLYGAVQQEVIAARLQRDFGVAAVFEEIRPVYLERPAGVGEAIEDTAMRTLEQGLHGWEVSDCAVALTHAGYSSPVSVAADFRNLTPLVLMRALDAAGCGIYEPCQAFEVEIPGDALSAVIGHLSALGADLRQSAESGQACLVTGEIPARLVQEFIRALPGLSRGEGAWWSHPGGDRPVRGAAPVRERRDGNPLNREEYLRFLANPG
jgi:ribosomal protection tetracycline resistance protein